MRIAVAVLLVFWSLYAAGPAVSDPLRILTTREPPANFMQDGEVTGTTTDIVREVLGILGEDIEIELMPWARAYLIAKTRPNIVIYTAGRTQERIDLGFHFLGPVISRKHSLWRRSNGTVGINGLADILERKLVISSVRQDWRTKYFAGQGAVITRTGDTRLGLKQLLRQRVDLWVASDIEAPTIAREAGVGMNDIEIAYVFKEAPSFIMLSNGTPDATVARWRAAFERTFEGDFYERAVRKWSKALGLSLGHSRARGFHIVQ